MAESEEEEGEREDSKDGPRKAVESSETVNESWMELGELLKMLLIILITLIRRRTKIPIMIIIKVAVN